MDHLGLKDDQKEKLQQYTDFTNIRDYDVAVGTLASLNWNVEQAIEAHLMQEDVNGDDDPEILETIPPRSSNHAGSSVHVRGRLDPEFVDLESEEMPAARGRRRGRVAAPDETTMVDNQVKRLRIDDEQNGVKASKKGAAVPRQIFFSERTGQAVAAEQTASSSSSSSSSTSTTTTTSTVVTRRHTRANPVATLNQPAAPEPARQNGTARQRVPMVPRQQVPIVPVQLDSDEDEDDDVLHFAYDDDDNHQNEPTSNSEVTPRLGGPPNGRVPMIPEGYTSVPDALRNFVAVFADRFCSTPTTQAFMPPFYTDTLPNAIKEAFEHPNSEQRRPLVFYINHDRSIAANIFASQVLCSEAISSLIRHQYILFPWDISSDTNLINFMEFLQASNMSDVRNLLQRLAMNKVETFPMMAIVVRERNTFRLVDVCRGTDTSEQVLEKLLAGVEDFSNVRLAEASEKREREEREAIRSQQEAEYKASLAADKARMEAKQREIEEQQQEEERKQKEEEDEVMRRQMIASTLPDEPPANAPAAEVINVKFRLPEGGQDMRRFRRIETIQTLINYLSSKGFSPDKYKYFNSDFPKKEITRHFDLSITFTDSKWPAREQIFVEEI